MRSFLLARTFFSTFFLTIGLFLWCTCNSGNSIAGGETLNEKTAYLPDGITPAIMAKVVFSNDSGVVKEEFTNNNGRFQIPSLRADTYSVYITKKYGNDTLSAIQTTAFISPDTHTVQDDTLFKTGKIFGFIKLLPGDMQKVTAVTIQIKGTLFEATPDANGRFEIINVPIHTHYIIKFTPPENWEYAPKVIQKQYKGEDSLSLGNVILDYTGIPIIDSVDIRYDSLNGVIKLSWEPVRYSNLLDYIVCRKLMNVNNAEIDSLEADTIPCFLDTIFSSSPDHYQQSIYDTASYKYLYWVIIRNGKLETGSSSANLDYTITVSSPFKYRAQFDFAFFDSGSNVMISSLPVNKTFAVIAKITSKALPFNSIIIQKEDGNQIIRNLNGGSVKKITDTLFLRDSSIGNKLLFYKVGLNKSYRDFDTASCILSVKDINLITDRVELLSPAIKDKPFSLKTTVKNIGASEIPPNSDITISYRFDNDKPILKKVSSDSMISILDSTDIAGSGWVMSPGSHKITISVYNEINPAKSTINDNFSQYNIYFSDLDLSLHNIVFNPSEPVSGDSVSLGIWVLNKGTTLFNDTLKLKYAINDTSLFESKSVQKISPNDSVLINNTFWKAASGDHKIKVEIENAPFVPVFIEKSPVIDSSDIYDINKENNSIKKSIKVNDYDLSFKSFTAKEISRDSGITYKAVIYNNGTATLKNAILSVNFLINNFTNTVIDTLITSISPEDSITIESKCNSNTVIYLSHGTTYEYNANAWIDPQNLISESDESNNRVSSIFTIKELYINGSFERNRPSDTIVYGWTMVRSNKDSTSILKWEDSSGLDKSKCISIEILNDSSDAHWAYNLKSAMLPGKKYKLSGWIKGENVKPVNLSVSANLCIENEINNHTTEPLSGTFDWTYVEMIYEVPDPLPDNFTGISCRLGNLLSTVTGKVYFDNVKLERIP